MEFEETYRAFERLGGTDIARIAGEYWENPTDEGRALYRDQCVPFCQHSNSKSKDWLSRTRWRNETALYFNGPNAERATMDFRGALHSVSCPVLLMVGEEDPMTPPVYSDVIAENLRDRQTTFHRFSNCGHGVISDKLTHT